MPAEYRIDESRGCVLSHARGVVTDDDLLGHQRRLIAEPGFRSDLNQLWDVRNLDGVEVTVGAIRTLAQLNPFGKGSRRALLVDSQLAYGLARMFQSYTDASLDEVEVFWDEAAAHHWLVLGEKPSWRVAKGPPVSVCRVR